VPKEAKEKSIKPDTYLIRGLLNHPGSLSMKKTIGGDGDMLHYRA
jgi:hypothetical protein